MIIYTCEFKKKNGELRAIKYVRPFAEPNDQDTQAFLNANVQGVKKQTLQEGFERVWDVEANGFRVINHNDIVKPVEPVGHAVYVPTTNTFVF
jgi:hypothetical protein